VGSFFAIVDEMQLNEGYAELIRTLRYKAEVVAPFRGVGCATTVAVLVGQPTEPSYGFSDRWNYK
jgi:hypothetical protein